jgi:hypothetical protein
MRASLVPLGTYTVSPAGPFAGTVTAFGGVLTGGDSVTGVTAREGFSC